MFSCVSLLKPHFTNALRVSGLPVLLSVASYVLSR